jgi:deoxyribonuclease V
MVSRTLEFGSMILAIDAQYSKNTAFVAGVAFSEWCSEAPYEEYVSAVYPVEKYEPGEFYKRELPCILKLLEEHDLKPEIIVIDGYVFLDGKQEPGLGKHLYDSLGGQIEIVGIAKKAFSGIEQEHAVLRGKSKKPLYVTTSGDLKSAKGHVSMMFGKNRIPRILRRVDQLCREEANKSKHSDAESCAGV